MVSEGAVISVPRGTILEVTSLDERWDHAHASIASVCQMTANLRVLDGVSAGEIIAVHISGYDRHLDTPESEDWDLPNWLEAVARA